MHAPDNPPMERELPSSAHMMSISTPRVRWLKRATIAGAVCVVAALVTGRAALAIGPATNPPTVGATVPRAPATPPQKRRKRSRRRTGSGTSARVFRSSGWTSPRTSTALASDLGGMLASHTRSGRWGALVVSLTRGDTLFAESPDARMQPASTMKLMTTALALDRFGPDHQFVTDVLRDGPLVDGTVQGNLYLRGGGDPALSTRFLHNGESAPMDSLAHLIHEIGVRRVAGDLVADATAFDAQQIPDGWQRRYLHSSYAAPVSALSLNENLVWIVVQPNANSTDVSLDPANTSIPVVNHVRLVAGGSGGHIVVRKAANGSMDVSGWIGSRSAPLKYSFVIDDPAAFAAGALRAALAKAGITVVGATRLGAAPATALVVAALASPPLSRLVAAMNRESINHFAELLFRDVARVAAASGVGSVQTGLETLRVFLAQKVGGDSGQILVSDGSGLSVNDQMTPRLMVHLLSYADKTTWSSTFHASLPVAGESELLRHRMKYTPAAGNLHAKTGTTNSVAALAGYVTAKNGEIIAFSFIYNGADRWNAKTAMDQMGATLAEFERD